MKLTNEQIGKIKHELKSFIGTQHYYKTIVPTMVYTDGIQYLAEKCGAYWLTDLVASYQTRKFKDANPFQLWTIKLLEGSQAVVTCREDTGRPNLVEQRIEYTDFPFDYEFYVVDGVMMVKTEY